MATKKREKDVLKPKKTFWHLYSLQTLSAEKFTKVVDKILNRDYGLIK